MIKIGLTGSIGMGKTETAKIFERENIPVFDSDQAVHELLNEDSEAIALVENLFPGVMQNNTIDRKLLGDRVFNNEDALKNLENILHPMVQEKRVKFSEKAYNDGNDIVVFDIPLLFEKGYEEEFDYVVVVSAPYEVQKKRVLARPGMTEKRFYEIQKKQMPDNDKRKRADFIIETDKGINDAERQVSELLKIIKGEMNA